MSVLKIQSFGGQVPRVSARALPAGAALPPICWAWRRRPCRTGAPAPAAAPASPSSCRRCWRWPAPRWLLGWGRGQIRREMSSGRSR